MADILKEAPLTSVQVEALVVMKIIKHCSQSFPSMTTGFLVGMDAKSTLEITNSFPFPAVEPPPTDTYHDSNNISQLAAAAPRSKANGVYQNEMIKKLREVNVDANNVGWYTSANLGNFVNMNMIENQYHYQKELNERTVALVHDVSRSSQGSLSLRAFRLSPAFMLAYKENKFTVESLQKSSFRYQDILLELPLQIHNSHLLTSFLHTLPTANTANPKIPNSLSELPPTHSLPSPLAPNLSTLTLSIDPFLSQTSDLLLEAIESHHTELNNHQYYQRSLAREQAKITAWQQKRKAENASRALTKQTPLPEDEWQRLFKLPTEPSRLEGMLNSRQVEQYARQVDGFTAGVTGKMFAVRSNLLPEKME
ncbi:MAG: hypothetical protein Q9213_006345 [Squamulea squamosa]